MFSIFSYVEKILQHISKLKYWLAYEQLWSLKKDTKVQGVKWELLWMKSLQFIYYSEISLLSLKSYNYHFRQSFVICVIIIQVVIKSYDPISSIMI